MPSNSDVDIAVIGTGLSGLAAANLLKDAGRQVQLYEAASKVGGRIQSFFDPLTDQPLGDRGPTWVWPEYQPAISKWLKHLKADVFEQYAQGPSVVETSLDQPAGAMHLPAQHGSMRIAGGTARLIDELLSRLPANTIYTDRPVQKIEDAGNQILLHFEDDIVRAHQVIIAVPPRIAAHTIEWQPSLTAQLTQSLHALPTWMAPHAKAVIVYARAFWRSAGLSGRIMSHVGPLMEVHDHCSIDGDTAALFGFVGWPYSVRAEQRSQLQTAIVEQLGRCFGQEALSPLHVLVEDWSANKFIVHPSDLVGPQSHPAVGPEIVRVPIWQGRLVFAAAETSRQSPGLIDGAFFAAETAAHSLLAG